MNDRTSPERLLAAWLTTEAPPRPPAGLRDDIVSATARVRPRPAWLARLEGNHIDVIVGGRARRDPSSRLRLLVIAAALGTLGIAYVVGGGSDARPALDSSTGPSPLASAAAPLASPTAEPAVTPSPTARPVRTDAVTPAGGILAFPAFDLEYRVPDGSDEMELARSRARGGWIAGFGVGAPGLSYGSLYDGGSGESSLVDGSRGVVVADVTFATLHSQGSTPRLGTDAANLIERIGRIDQYRVEDVVPLNLNGRPALRADVWSWAPYPLMDVRVSLEGEFEEPHIEFSRPTRIIVTDVGDAIVLIQLWAATPPPYEAVPTGLSPEVRAWIPSAMELIEWLRFVEAE